MSRSQVFSTDEIISAKTVCVCGGGGGGRPSGELCAFKDLRFNRDGFTQWALNIVLADTD